MSTRLIAGAAAPPAHDYDADIIILALERAEETLAAIASARHQVGLSKHVFVLDQGSSRQTLQRLASAIDGQSDVTLVATDSNLGVAGGRNLLSSLGRARVIIGLDNDAEFATVMTAARMVATLQSDPRLGAIGCRIVNHMDGSDDLSSWGYPASLLPCAGACFDAVTFVGAGHAILRKAWHQAGGYDARLFFCWEEFDFSLRALALGWRIRYCGDIVIRHKISADQRVAWSASRWFYFVRNRLYIERKLDRGWLELTPRIAGYLVKGLRNGLPMQTLRAIAAAIAMSPGAFARRMPPDVIAYLARNDRAHRGSLFQRLMREVVSRIGAVADGASTAE